MKSKNIILCFFLTILPIIKGDDFYRPFFENFLKGSEFKGTLPDTCMTGMFDIYLENMRNFARQYNGANVILNAFMLYTTVNETCPIDYITNITEIIKRKVKDFSVYYFVIQNLYDTAKLMVDEILNPNSTSATFGYAIGTAIKPYLSEDNKRRNLRGNDIELDLDILFSFLNGLIQGLSKNDTSLCKNSFFYQKDLFTKLIKEINQMNDDKKKMNEILYIILTKIENNSDLYNNCRINQLIESINDYSKEKFFIQILTRSKEERKQILNDLVYSLKSLIKKNHFDFGLGIGKIMKIILNFYVN